MHTADNKRYAYDIKESEEGWQVVSLYKQGETWVVDCIEMIAISDKWFADKVAAILCETYQYGRDTMFNELKEKFDDSIGKMRDMVFFE